MSAVTFLHTADWQLGMRRHFLDDEALPRFMQARIDVIEEMARVAADAKCAFAVVCGDVWESNQLHRRTVGRALEALAAFPCPVYLLPGNHDPYDAGSVYLSDEFDRGVPSNVQVIKTSRAAPVDGVPGVELVGVPWPTKHPRRDLVAEAVASLSPAESVVRVCVAHGMVDELSPDQDNPELIVAAGLEQALESGRLHFVALGDRHSTTKVRDRVWYAGSPEPTDYRETDAGNVLVVEVSADHCEVTPHPVGQWHFEKRDLQLDSAEDVNHAREILEGLPDKDVTILKLTLRGTLSLRAKAELDALLEHQGDLLAGLEIWDRHTDLAVLPDDFDHADLDVGGFVRQGVEALKEQAQGEGDEAGTARDALALLYRLAVRRQS